MILRNCSVNVWFYLGKICSLLELLTVRSNVSRLSFPISSISSLAISVETLEFVKFLKSKCTFIFPHAIWCKNIFEKYQLRTVKVQVSCSDLHPRVNFTHFSTERLSYFAIHAAIFSQLFDFHVRIKCDTFLDELVRMLEIIYSSFHFIDPPPSCQSRTQVNYEIENEASNYENEGWLRVKTSPAGSLYDISSPSYDSSNIGNFSPKI